MRARGSQTLRTIGIVLTVVALVGLIQFIRGQVNAGAILIPVILSAVFLFRSRPVKGSPDGKMDGRVIKAMEGRSEKIMLMSGRKDERA